MNLREESKRISNNLHVYKEELKDTIKTLSESIERTTEDFKQAAAQGDHSENAAYVEAQKKLAVDNQSLFAARETLALLEGINDVNYKAIGLVTLYSTVELKCSEFDEHLVYKVYPDGISDINRGILAKDSLVGSQLMFKGIGTTFTVNHRVTGEMIVYTIVDIY